MFVEITAVLGLFTWMANLPLNDNHLERKTKSSKKSPVAMVHSNIISIDTIYKLVLVQTELSFSNQMFFCIPTNFVIRLKTFLFTLGNCICLLFPGIPVV